MACLPDSCSLRRYDKNLGIDSQETKDKISAAKTGQKRSEETRKKISLGHKRKRQS
jgi:hypothetical protein